MIRSLCGRLKSLLLYFGDFDIRFQSINNSGIVPAKMKLAGVVPLYKSGDKSVLSNYRPLLVLPVFSKFLAGKSFV